MTTFNKAGFGKPWSTGRRVLGIKRAKKSDQEAIRGYL
jgi:hypothetical protein